MRPHDWNSYLAAEAEVDEMAAVLVGETTGVLRYIAAIPGLSDWYWWLFTEGRDHDPRP